MPLTRRRRGSAEPFRNYHSRVRESSPEQKKNNSFAFRIIFIFVPLGILCFFYTLYQYLVSSPEIAALIEPVQKTKKLTSQLDFLEDPDLFVNPHRYLCSLPDDSLDLPLEQKNRCLPSFLIIGGVKCGTTSAYEYLLKHPAILKLRNTHILPEYAKAKIRQELDSKEQDTKAIRGSVRGHAPGMKPDSLTPRKEKSRQTRRPRIRPLEDSELIDGCFDLIPTECHQYFEHDCLSLLEKSPHDLDVNCRRTCNFCGKSDDRIYHAGGNSSDYWNDNGFLRSTWTLCHTMDGVVRRFNADLIPHLIGSRSLCWNALHVERPPTGRNLLAYHDEIDRENWFLHEGEEVILKQLEKRKVVQKLLRPHIGSKEIRFFNDFRWHGARKLANSYDETFSWYLDQFPQIYPQDPNNPGSLDKNRGRITGESSPTYLMGGLTVASRIQKYLPKVNIIIFLRNPVDRFISMRQMLLDMRDLKDEVRIKYGKNPKGEPTVSLDDLVDASFAGSDKNRGKVPKEMVRKVNKALRESSYAETLHHWLEIFRRDQILIVQSEEFFTDTIEVIHKMEKHLGILKMPFEFWNPHVKDAYNLKLDPEKHTFQRVKGSEHKHTVEISDKSRDMLRDYFRPLNDRLLELLGTRFYGWDYS